MAPVLVDAKIRGPNAQARGLRQQVRDVLHPRPARRHARRSASTRCRCRRTPRQKTSPTQPFPRQGGWTENCVVDQPLGTAVPGNPNRAVPNYVQGCLYAAHWDIPILSIPGHGGGAGLEPPVVQSEHGPGVHRLRLRRRRALARPRPATACARRANTRPAASSPSIRRTNRGAVEEAHAVLAGARQRHPDHRVATCCSSASPTATCSRSMRRTATSCGASRPAPRSAPARSPTRSTASSTSRSTPAAPAFRTATRRRAATILWAFRLGGDLPPAPTPAAAGRAPAGLGHSGRGQRRQQHRAFSRAPTTPRRTRSARRSRPAVNGMAPTHLRVPVGTTVTFANPADQR